MAETSEFSLETVVKHTGIVVKVWHQAFSIKPPGGHYNFGFTSSEVDTKEDAEQIVLALLEKIDLTAFPPSSKTICLNSKGEIEYFPKMDSYSFIAKLLEYPSAQNVKEQYIQLELTVRSFESEKKLEDF